MGTFYRVFPYVARARDNEPGSAVFIPPQGGGRLDQPDHYSVLYVSDHAAGAIAEAFGRFPEWTPEMLSGPPSLVGSVRAIAKYHVPDDAPICNLDDARQLVSLELRPSDVVTREYSRSRAWAKRVYLRREWIGVRWWSYYDPKWASVGLWDTRRLRVEQVEQLDIEHPSLLEASRTIVRRIARASG